MTWKRQSPTIKIKKKKIPAVYCIVLFFVGLKKKKKKKIHRGKEKSSHSKNGQGTVILRQGIKTSGHKLSRNLITLMPKSR